MSWEFDEDLITAEPIEDEEDAEPCIGIACIPGKGYVLETVFTNPVEVAQILTGLATDILAKETYGSNNRANRFSRRP